MLNLVLGLRSAFRVEAVPAADTCVRILTRKLWTVTYFIKYIEESLAFVFR